MGEKAPPAQATPRDLSHEDSKDIMSAIAAASLDALITIDGQGRVIEFSPAAEKLFGFTREETLGLSVADVVIPPRLRDAHNDGMRRYEATGEGPVINTRVEVPAARKDGSEFEAELTVVPLRIEGKRFFTAFVRDISEQKAAQAALEKAREAAEEASEAKSRFLATVSHELRTPLNAVLGVMDLIGETPRDARDGQLIHTARESALSLLTMIDEIIDMASLERGELALKPKPTDIAALVDQIAEQTREAAERKNLRMQVDRQGEWPQRVMLDERRFVQVLAQLLDNAVKFSDAGIICLKASCAARGEADGAYALSVEISDQGMGMDEATRDGLSKPFFQAHNLSTTGYSGTGIGLAVCMRLLEQMGARLTIHSAPGQGSRFSFTLELDGCQPTTATTKGPAIEGAPARVLVVDDGMPNRLIAETMLRRAGYDVDQAVDGAEAVDKVEKQAYAAVLMDMRMPNLDGLEATRQIRQLTGRAGRTPIIAMTANVSESDRRACIASGMNDFLAKPVRKEELLAMLSVWCPDALGPVRGADG